MSSKSSSGSLVKSVESILPKGVNLKHVLLAVLVGLLLCMMFGQTVESFAGDFDSPSAGYCKNTGGGASDQSSCIVSDDFKRSAEGAAFQCVPSDPGSVAPPRALVDADVTTESTGLAAAVSECSGDSVITSLSDECKAALDAGASCDVGNVGGGGGDGTVQRVWQGDQTTTCRAKDIPTTAAQQDDAAYCGVSDNCSVSTSSEAYDCTNLRDNQCPGSDTFTDESGETIPAADRDTALSTCSWQSCTSFATGGSEIETALNSPLEDDSLGRWRTCVAENTGDGWAAIKLAIKDTNQTKVPSAWNADGTWTTGIPTRLSKVTLDGVAADAASADEVKAIVYKDAGRDDGYASVFGNNGNALPSPSWKSAIEKQLKFCGAPADTDWESGSYTVQEALDNGAALGWDVDGKSLICLNNNPAVRTHIRQERVPSPKMPGCGDNTMDCYCNSDGCPCSEGILPTDAQINSRNQTCGTGDAEAALVKAQAEIDRLQNDIRSRVISNTDGVCRGALNFLSDKK
jgi:hypothetical protein